MADVVIPQFDFASGDYGYAAVGPFNLREDSSTAFKVLGLATDPANSKQYTSATAGAVGNAATTLIAGLTLVSTVGGANANTACVANARLSVGIV